MPAPPLPYARLVDRQLAPLLGGLAAVSIEGARGVGKTWTARQHGQTFVAVDDPDEREQLARLGARFVEGLEPPVVLDEWQRLPEVWDRVRRAVDRDLTPGRFILTGSASPTSSPVHTGAGRIATLRMRPLSLVERGLEEPTVSLASLLAGEEGGKGGGSGTDVEGRTTVALEQYVDEILRSGLPGIRDLAPTAREAQLDAYIEQTVRHDLAEEDPGTARTRRSRTSRRARTLRDWLRAYAAAVSTPTAYDTLSRNTSRALGSVPAQSTTRQYRDLLEAMWILDPVPGWTPSQGVLARVNRGDKHHLCDPALAARLLHVGSAGLLGVGYKVRDTPSGAPRRQHLLGPLYESLVTQSVQVYAALAGARVYHLRTKGGVQEVDLIVEGSDQRVVAVEVKATATPRGGDTRHLLWLRDRLGPALADMVVVTTGAYAYRDEDGVAVVPAALLGP